MATFVTRFLNMKNPEAATIHDVVDHIFHIAEVAGWECVGVGSDFSGTPAVPIGLEVSPSPRALYWQCTEFSTGRIQISSLVALLLERGATDEEVRMFAGENRLRVWGNIEKTGQLLRAQGSTAIEAVWEGRLDTWPVGLISSPFMYRETKDSRGVEEVHTTSTSTRARVFTNLIFPLEDRQVEIGITRYYRLLPKVNCAHTKSPQQWAKYHFSFHSLDMPGFQNIRTRAFALRTH